MTLNEAMMKHTFISKVLLKLGDKELSRDLKVKVMSMRIELGKLRKQLDEDLKEVLKEITPENYSELSTKESRTEEENKTLETMVNQINEDYNAYLSKRGQEEVTLNLSLTTDEFNEIIEVNAGNDVEINGQKLNAADFLEVLYSLFVA